jgi:uncharacterized membrane protein YfcA
MSGLELGAYLVTGVLSGLLAGLFGLGGGVVVVPALIWVFSHAAVSADWVPHLAVGSSLATIIGTGSASVLAHHRRGAVRWDVFLRLAPGIVLGAWAGSALAGVLPELWLKRVFGLFLLLVGVRMLWPRSAEGPARSLPGRLGIGLAGGGIGTLSALVGIGGGTLTVPFLVRGGIDMRRAVATAAACALPIAVAGTLGFVVTGWGREGLPAGSTGFVYWPAVAAILVASMPTAPLGARLAHRLPVNLLQRAFGLVVLAVAVRLLWP